MTESTTPVEETVVLTPEEIQELKEMKLRADKRRALIKKIGMRTAFTVAVVGITFVAVKLSDPETFSHKSETSELDNQ